MVGVNLIKGVCLEEGFYWYVYGFACYGLMFGIVVIVKGSFGGFDFFGIWIDERKE